MRIEGKRVKRTRFIQQGRFVVAVDVELVVPRDDPREPCLESETVELLKQVQARAKRGDVKWLRRVGKVYELLA